MYETFYHFKDKPFSLLPDPGYLFLSQKHQMALTLLEYSVLNQAGFCVLSGETGAGKTTLIRHLLNQFDDNISVGLITNTHKSFGELLRWILMAYDLDYSGKNKVQLYRAFIDFLIDQYAQNRHTVLIVDEAQNMTADTLEELRMLSNVNADKDQVLQIILVGQPGLRKNLRGRELEQFAQRIAVDYDLQPLDDHEVEGYIRHRLEIAGGDPALFSSDACAAIYHYTGGTPRLINLLCDTALVYGYAEQCQSIQAHLIHEVIRERQHQGLLPAFHGSEDRQNTAQAFVGRETLAEELKSVLELETAKPEMVQAAAGDDADQEHAGPSSEAEPIVSNGSEVGDPVEALQKSKAASVTMLETSALKAVAGRGTQGDTSNDSIQINLLSPSDKLEAKLGTQEHQGQTSDPTYSAMQITSEPGSTANNKVSQLFRRDAQNEKETAQDVPHQDHALDPGTATSSSFGKQYGHSNTTTANTGEAEVDHRASDRSELDDALALQNASTNDDNSSTCSPILDVDSSASSPQHDKDSTIPGRNAAQVGAEAVVGGKGGLPLIIGFMIGMVASVVLIVMVLLLGDKDSMDHLFRSDTQMAGAVGATNPKPRNALIQVDAGDELLSASEKLKLEEAKMQALERERDAALAEARALQRERDAALEAAHAQDKIRAAEIEAARARKRERTAALEAAKARQRIRAVEQAVDGLRRERDAALAISQVKLREQSTSGNQTDTALAPNPDALKRNDSPLQNSLENSQNSATAEVQSQNSERTQNKAAGTGAKQESVGFSANPCKGPSAIFLSTCRE